MYWEWYIVRYIVYIGSPDNRNSRINLAIVTILLFKEAKKINETKPTLNTGLKASKELRLF